MLLDAERFHRARPIDLVVFSGDLGFAGKKADFDLARELLLDPLTTKLSLANDRVVLAAGNHDVDRSRVNEIFEAGLRASLTTRGKVNELLEDKRNRTDACRRLDAWERFHSDFYTGTEGPTATGFLAHVHKFDFDGTTVGVAAVNSAWRCSGDDDFKNVLIGARQIEDALDSIEPDSIRIVAVHHPLSWLANFDAKGARSEFERRAHLVLSGHEHTAEPESVTSARGTAVFAHAGCLYESHEYLNSYSVIDVDPDRNAIDLTLRTWWADRGQFDAAVDVAAEGKVSFPMRAGEDDVSVRGAEGPPVERGQDETRFVVRVHACALLADDLGSAARTFGEKRRMIGLIRREVPGLVEDERVVQREIEAKCAGAMPLIDQFLRRDLREHVEVIEAVVSIRESGGEVPDDLDDARKRSREAFTSSRLRWDDRLRASPAFAVALDEQEEVGVWRALGFPSLELFREQLQPTMRSMVSPPGELAELVLEKLLEHPVSPTELEAEGVPESVTVDLLNRVLASEWARWQGDKVAITDLGGQLLRKRLTKWQQAG